MAGLLGASPYVTKWMLYRKFKYGDDFGTEPDNRMDWGTRLQPLLLRAAADDLRFEVRPNDGDDYVRRGLLGCTRDADIICPDRGPGALEIKCCFDYRTWMDTWAGGDAPPRHVEVQCQQQMYVGDGTVPYKWGVIGVWVCGEMKYFNREPIPDLWEEMTEQARRFFEDVEAGREPNAFGSPAEIPLMNQLWRTPSGRVIDARDREDANALAWFAVQMKEHGSNRAYHDKEEKRLKDKFRAIMLDADRLLLPFGIIIDLKRSPRAGYTVEPSVTHALKPFIPPDANPPPPQSAKEEGGAMLTDLAGG